MKAIKKFMIICLVLGVFFSDVRVAHAQDITTSIAMEVLDLFADVMVNREIDVYDCVFENSEEKEYF